MKSSNCASHLTKPILLAAILMANLAFTVAANAQSGWVGKFTLPYEVHWNHAVLPPGDYIITMDSKYAPALIRAAHGTRSVYTSIPLVASREEGGASLLITERDGQRTVRFVNSPLLGVSFIYQAIPRPEREALAKTGQLESVPVMVAKK